jgi:hypothetical protein
MDLVALPGRRIEARAHSVSLVQERIFSQRLVWLTLVAS